jgi:hypothetical protein
LAYADFEAAKNFYIQRKREIEDVIFLLQERVEAEKAYSLRLQKIGNSALFTHQQRSSLFGMNGNI